jgi:hypothetical protein
MDYLIVALKKILDWTGACFAFVDTIDLAGALISPLLGIAAGIFLFFWSRSLAIPHRAMLLLIYAVSPILVHGTVLGRPDHQSLLILLVAVALGSEWAMLNRPSRAWSVSCGLAWGFGLWVSLYEPLVLLAAVTLLVLVFDRRRLWSRERVVVCGCLGCILLVALLLEGWRIVLPGGTTVKYFTNWRREIGELSMVAPLSPLLFRWLGLGLVFLPVLLFLRSRSNRRFAACLFLLLLAYGFTLYQLRWGYFFALIFAMTLPLGMAFFRRRYVAWGLFAISLWPILREWDETLFPSETRQGQLAEEKLDAVLLRDAAEKLRGDERRPILAPWWLSPALVYWSGQPAVGGSSHESLPGTVDTARFYLAESPAEARAILRERGVQSVVAYDSGRVVQTSATLLGRSASESPLAAMLYASPHSAPDFLKLEYANQSFKIFKVEE